MRRRQIGVLAKKYKRVKSTKKVLKKCTDEKNSLFFAKIKEYIHEK